MLASISISRELDQLPAAEVCAREPVAAATARAIEQRMMSVVREIGWCIFRKEAESEDARLPACFFLAKGSSCYGVLVVLVE